MAIKDKAVKWYIKNIEMPKREVQDRPGFMGENMGENDLFLRDIAIPESIFIGIEENIEDVEALYRIGKQFGYRYASNSEFQQCSEVSEKKFRQEAYLFVQYIESVSYGKDFEYDLNYDEKVFRLETHDFIACRKDGKGHILSSGGVAGIWSYVVSDQTVEGAQIKCQGRGDDKCITICGPRDKLDNRDIDYTEKQINRDRLGVSRDYSDYNHIQEASFAETSFKDFKDVGFFNYRDDLFYHENERYLWCESSLVYLLGSDLENKHAKELYKSAYDYGKQLAEQESDRDMEKFITEYLSACGWGDTLVKEKNDKFEVQGHLFPWTKFWEETEFPIYRGLVSGLLTGYSDREVKLTEVEKDIKGECFTVIVSEE